ncbi:hypothetical protein [Elizabethkingia occulta]|uniref:hypothetical protein n=1 Tax=Elizabethkingia occulta TaxID=1867263 RepID=UPI000BEAEF94|nr:hypothetical protein CQS02_02160 [Elizabethkingia miricola]MDV3561484.1 hypothetical protein [Elizabethkingia anophelis]
MKINHFFKTNALAIAAIIFAGTTMSFKLAEKKAAPVTYFYNSSLTSAGAFADPSHWQATDLPGCETEGERPCKIIVPDGSSINAVLSGKTNAQVLSISMDRRP